VRVVPRAEACVAGEALHGAIVEERLAVEAADALSSRVALKAGDEEPSDALTLPAVRDRDRELRRLPVPVRRVAALADDHLAFLGEDLCHESEVLVVVHLCEAPKKLGRQLPQGPEEAVAPRSVREGPDEGLHDVRVLRQDRTQDDALASMETHHVDELGGIAMDRIGHGEDEDPRPGALPATSASMSLRAIPRSCNVRSSRPRSTAAFLSRMRRSRTARQTAEGPINRPCHAGPVRTRAGATSGTEGIDAFS
jgi:hypothetical protein